MMNHFTIIARYYVAAIFFLVTSFGLSSCNDKPTAIGGEFLTDTLSVYALTSSPENPLILDAQSDIIRGFTGAGNPPFNSGTVFVGQGNGVSSFGMIKFIDFPDSLGDTTKYEIQSAKLLLRTRKYSFGDTTNNLLNLSVVNVLQNWFPSSTLDTIQAKEVSAPFFGEVLATYSGSPAINDSSTIEIPFSNAQVIRSWFYKYRKNADSTERASVYGIGLRPVSGTNIIRTFKTGSLGSSPEDELKLKVVVNRLDASRLDTITLSSGLVSSIIDAPKPAKKSITLAGGVATRAHLYFDVSKIPSLAAIHKAELVLTWDSSSSVFGNTGSEYQLQGYFGKDSSYFSNDPAAYIASRPDSSSRQFVFRSISSAIERWKRGTANYGLIIGLEGSNELNRLSRLSFYSPLATDTTKRPKLTIIYSTRPKK